MKHRILFYLFFSTFVFHAQITIKGKVFHNKAPLEGAAVYFNNTMVGTTTDTNGEFSIRVKEGQYELIVSYLGYKTINYTLSTSTYVKPLLFVLQEDENVLDEIVLKQIIYDDEWNYNFYKFRREFIGTTKLADGCKILNPKVLYFEFNAKTNTLQAFARKPLKIKHQSLGYLITYDLVAFTIQHNMVSYLGYSRYEALKGNKRKLKKWKKSRLKAYNGSPVHFYKSLLQNNLKKEGYVVNQFRRVPNAERPSELEIKRARQLIRLHRKAINFSDKIINPKNALDSALVTVRKVKLPKYNDYLYKSKLQENEIIKIDNDTIHLIFNDNLSIIYKKEKEEQRYLKRQFLQPKRLPTYQTSSMITIQKPIILDKSGVLLNPLSIYYEGYWSFEKFANSLPLDYSPKTN